MVAITFRTERTLWTVDTEAFTYLRTPLEAGSIHPAKEYVSVETPFDDAVMHYDMHENKYVSFTGLEMYKFGIMSGGIVDEDGSFDFEELHRPRDPSQEPTILIEKF